MFRLVDSTDKLLSDSALNGLSLSIEDIDISYPLTTLLPFYALTDDHIPELKQVLKYQRYEDKIIKNDLRKNKFELEIDIDNAIKIAINLIGLKFISKKKKKVNIESIKKYFAVNIFDLNELSMNLTLEQFYSFNFSNFLEIRNDIKLENIPFIKLIRAQPELICSDSIVQIACGFLRYFCLNEVQDYSSRAKKILRKSELALFLPKGRKKQTSHNQNLINIKQRPQLLYILVELYESIIGSYLKKYYKKEEKKIKSADIAEAFKHIYQQEELPEKLFDVDYNCESDIDFEGDDSDHKSTALSFIANEYGVTYPALDRHYSDTLGKKHTSLKELFVMVYPAEINGKIENRSYSILPTLIEKFHNSKPHLAKEIKQIDKSISTQLIKFIWSPPTK